MRPRIGMSLSGRRGQRFWLIVAAAVVTGGAASTSSTRFTHPGYGSLSKVVLLRANQFESARFAFTENKKWFQ